MRTISVLIAAFSSLIFVLTSAFPAMSVERFPLVFHDDGGTTIQLPAPAKRIVALYGAFNDMLLEMELGNRIVARTKADTRPELAALPVIGTHMRPNFEKVAALHPDLILQFEGRQEAHDQVQRLRALGLKVAVFHGANFADMFRIMKSIGVLTGEEAKAEACVAIMQKRLAAVAAKREGKKRPRIFFEIRFPNLLAAGSASMAAAIIEAAGGVNAVSLPERVARLNEEELIRIAPDSYLIQKGPMNASPLPLTERPHYKTLSAVKENRVLVVDEALFSRPAPGAIQAAEELAAWLDSVFTEDESPQRARP